jgi:hypothetical protein
MNPTFGYHINDQVFHTRLEFIEHCEKHHNAKELFDSGQFKVYNLPSHINSNEEIDPIDSTARWMNKIKEDAKPTVLLFGGGLDSTLVLDFMIKANHPPDYILTTTIDPFDNPDFLSGLDMEARYTLKYVKEIIDNNSVLKNTKIWHNHLGKEYAEKMFAGKEWLRTLTLFHSVESLAPHKFLPGLSEDEKQKYTFIKGGNFPKVSIVDGEPPQFYLVDLQLGTAIDTPVKYTYDFILDNPEMFKYMTLQYYKQVTKGIDPTAERSLDNMFECHTDHTDKRYLNDFKKFIPTMPPILDKRFETLLPWIEDLEVDESIPYYSYLHRAGLKSWLVYLQAEWMKPNWFENYKKTFIENENWIRRIRSYPGKITEFIKIKDFEKIEKLKEKYKKLKDKQ